MYPAKPTMTTAGPKKYLALCSGNFPKLILQQLKDDSKVVLTTHKGYLLSPFTFYQARFFFFFKLTQFASFSSWYTYRTFWSLHRDEFLGLGGIFSELK